MSIEYHLTAYSRISVGSVLLDQAARHPELRPLIIIYTTANVGTVTAYDATVERQYTPVQYTSAVTYGITTRYGTLSHDGEHTVVYDNTTVLHSSRKRTVQRMPVQIQHHRSVFRHRQRIIRSTCDDISSQLDHSTRVHCALQSRPTGNLLLLGHLDTRVLTLQFRDLSVLERHVQGLLTHTRLSRQVASQRVRVRAIPVSRLGSLRECAERQVEGIRAAHE